MLSAGTFKKDHKSKKEHINVPFYPSEWLNKCPARL